MPDTCCSALLLFGATGELSRRQGSEYRDGHGVQRHAFRPSPYGRYPKQIKAFAREVGATAQVAGGVPAM